jgi:hypothetical protein
MAFTPSMLESSTQANTQFQIVLRDNINLREQEAYDHLVTHTTSRRLPSQLLKGSLKSVPAG